MDNEKLRTQLEHLHAELQQADSLDPGQREMLQTLANDIDQLLKAEEIKSHHYQGLSERFSDIVAQLEASHPQITLLLRQAIDSLAFLGV